MTGNSDTGVVVQERDRHLLRELAVMRVVDREQAQCVAGFGSTTRANCRLLALTRAGLLRRFFLGTTGGGKKALYVLSPSGAKLVEVSQRSFKRKRDEILVADFFVTHQLFVNRLYCEFKYGRTPDPEVKFRRWLSFSQPLDRATPLVPDGYVELAGSMATLAAFVEVDLGHERLSAWRAKIRSYLQYAVSGNFQAQFGQPRFRVLVVADPPGRLASLRATTAALTDKIFRFATFDSIGRQGIWSPVWLRPKDGEPQSLVQTP